jgi:REP element-mobilizing transposase RayT
MARGVDRRRIFVDDDDFETYKRLLGFVVERQGWRLLSFCLMPNHVHLLIQTPDPNLGNGMQLLHGQYARAFNQRHSRVGHLFENRFASPLITNEGNLVRTVRYIVQNPVAARLCDKPEEWPWASHKAVAAKKVPDWLAHPYLCEVLDGIIGAVDYAKLVSA